MSQLGAAQRIKDFDDASFDPKRTFDEGHGSELVTDPYPMLLEMLAQGPVHKLDIADAFGAPRDLTMEGLEHYAVLSYAAVKQAFSDPLDFSPRLYKRNLGLAFGESVIVAMDDPHHRKLRNLVQAVFASSRMRCRNEALVAGVMEHLIEGFVDNGRADLVAEFAAHFPFNTIAALCGLPREEWPLFHRLAMGLTCISFDFAHAMEASGKLWDYFSRVLEDYRAAPGEDMISILANAEVDGVKLTDEEVVTFLRFLLNAGGDTTFEALPTRWRACLPIPSSLRRCARIVRLLIKPSRRGCAGNRLSCRCCARRGGRLSLMGLSYPRARACTCAWEAPTVIPPCLPTLVGSTFIATAQSRCRSDWDPTFAWANRSRA